MTIQEINTKFQNVINELKGDAMGNIMVNLGSDALALIRKRILETGVNAEGQKYAPYSNKPMLSGCSNWLNKSKCTAHIGSKSKQKKNRKKSAYTKYLEAESGAFELKWVTLKRGGKNIRLYEIYGGYKEFRELNLGPGHSSYVDFMFSGRMWQNIKLTTNRDELNNGIVIIKATDPKEQIKLKGNAERRGPILKLSNDELNFLQVNFNNRISKFLESNGLKQ